MFALVTVLALLFLGAAKADYRLKWRHAPAGDSKRFIAGCDAQGQSGVGAPYSLVTNYHGCYKDFRGGQTVTDKLGPIYWGGFYHYLARCMDAGEGESHFENSARADGKAIADTGKRSCAWRPPHSAGLRRQETVPAVGHPL